jgi:hypothetical protein
MRLGRALDKDAEAMRRRRRQCVGEGSGDRRREVLHNLRVIAMWHNLRVIAMQLVPPWDVSA